MLIVSTMFAAGMAAAGTAGRDRRTQSEIRTGVALARALMSEITQQVYADSAPDTIAQTPGISSTDRGNWKRVNDYCRFSESPPKARAGGAIEGAAGWTWASTVVYKEVGNLGASSGGTAPSGSGLLAAIVRPVVGVPTGLIGADAVKDTGLKQIVVTVTSPTGAITTLIGLRCSAGVVDRTSESPGFHTYTSVTLTVGEGKSPVSTGVPMLNTPALP